MDFHEEITQQTRDQNLHKNIMKIARTERGEEAELQVAHTGFHF